MLFTDDGSISGDCHIAKFISYRNSGWIFPYSGEISQDYFATVKIDSVSHCLGLYVLL